MGTRHAKSWARGRRGGEGRWGRKKDVRVRAFSIQRTQLSRSLEQATTQSARTVLFTSCLLNDISLYTDVVLFFSFVLFGNHYPLRWRSINPPRFISDLISRTLEGLEEKIEGL